MRIVFEPENSDLEEINVLHRGRLVLLKRGVPSMDFAQDFADELLRIHAGKFRAAAADELPEAPQ